MSPQKVTNQYLYKLCTLCALGRYVLCTWQGMVIRSVDYASKTGSHCLQSMKTPVINFISRREMYISAAGIYISAREIHISRAEMKF